jgi:hypothetical protein
MHAGCYNNTKEKSAARYAAYVIQNEAERNRLVYTKLSVHGVFLKDTENVETMHVEWARKRRDECKAVANKDRCIIVV